jgi:hypothetical protein
MGNRACKGCCLLVRFERHWSDAAAAMAILAMPLKNWEDIPVESWRLLCQPLLREGNARRKEQSSESATEAKNRDELGTNPSRHTVTMRGHYIPCSPSWPHCEDGVYVLPGGLVPEDDSI